MTIYKNWNDIDVTTSLNETDTFLISGGNLITASGVRHELLQIPDDTGYLFFGDASTDGSIRVRKSGLIAYKEIRISGSWVGLCIKVYPSGDTTGAIDYANLQAAFDISGYNVVQISGTYYVNQQLEMGPKTLTGTVMPLSTSYPLATNRADYIFAAGELFETTDYIMKIQGGVVENVEFKCEHKCRGVVFITSKYLPYLAKSMRIVNASIVALDLVDCYGSTMYGITISNCWGIAIRMHRCNSFQAYNTRLTAIYLCRNSDSDDNVTTWEYACANGNAAAAVNVEGYTEDWPEDDEEIIQDISDNYIQTAEEDRAAIVIGSDSTERQDLTQFHGLLFEPIYACDYPAVAIYRGITCEFRNVRVEGGYYSGAVFQVRSPSPATVRAACNIGIYYADVQTAYEKPKYLVHATGGSRNIVCEDCHTHEYVTEAIIVCDSGTHYNPTVRRQLTTLPGVENVLTLNDATVNGEEYIHGVDATLYLGDRRTNGSWRVSRSGDDVAWQRREAGNWVTKSTIDDTGYLFFGDASTNGTVRKRKSGRVIYEEVLISDSWVPKSATVYPSDDTSGETDRTSIQAAIDALESTDSSRACGTVYFAGGRYYIDQTISVNTYDTRSTNYRVLLNGGGGTQIDVVSGFTGNYAFEFYGKSLSGLEPCLTGMYIDCNYRCRGILFYYQTYRTLMENVYLYGTIGVAIDAIDSYGSTISQCLLNYIRGMCFRGHRFNSSSISHVKMRGWGCRCSDADQNEDMWTYDCINGRTAASGLYDGDDGYGTYTEYWLEPDDTTIIDTSSNYVQTGEDDRCQVYLQGNNIYLNNVNLETSAYCSYPAIFAKGSSNVDCNQIRMEGSYNGYCMFAVDGESSHGNAITFSQVQFRESDLIGSGNKQHVVVAKSRSVGLHVCDCQLRGFGGNVIYAEDGDHTQATVERIWSQVNEIPPSSYLGAAGGASITADFS